ncbi:MAG: hypothetical protein JWN85_3962 [Gammaproteobacteria bacterium]|nr:hypothetical protein [Gammaproteobacteria bacterium]
MNSEELSGLLRAEPELILHLSAHQVFLDFPVTVVGNESRNRTYRGILKRAIWFRQNSIISSASAVCPSRSRMMAHRHRTTKPG